MLVTSDTFLNDWVGYFTWSQCWWTGTIGHGLPTKPSFIFNILFAKIEWKWVDIDWWFKIQRMWWSFKIALWGVDPVSSKLQAGWLLSPEQSYNCPCTITHSRCWLPTQTLEADPNVIKSLCKFFLKKQSRAKGSISTCVKHNIITTLRDCCMLHNIDCGDGAQHSADCSHINQRGPAALQHEHAASAVKVATKCRGTKYRETVVLPKIGTLVHQNPHWWAGPFG